MKTKLLSASLFITLLFLSCKSEPSEDEISKKILMEYVCPETAKVVSLKISDSKETETIIGGKAYAYMVSGEVEWPAGCTDFGTGITAGYKEPFENKTVTLAKTEDGWQ